LAACPHRVGRREGETGGRPRVPAMPLATPPSKLPKQARGRSRPIDSAPRPPSPAPRPPMPSTPGQVLDLIRIELLAGVRHRSDRPGEVGAARFTHRGRDHGGKQLERPPREHRVLEDEVVTVTGLCGRRRAGCADDRYRGDLASRVARAAARYGPGRGRASAAAPRESSPPARSSHRRRDRRPTASS